MRESFSISTSINIANVVFDKDRQYYLDALLAYIDLKLLLCAIKT